MAYGGKTPWWAYAWETPCKRLAAWRIFSVLNTSNANLSYMIHQSICLTVDFSLYAYRRFLLSTLLPTHEPTLYVILYLDGALVDVGDEVGVIHFDP